MVWYEKRWDLALRSGRLSLLQHPQKLFYADVFEFLFLSSQIIVKIMMEPGPGSNVESVQLSRAFIKVGRTRRPWVNRLTNLRISQDHLSRTEIWASLFPMKGNCPNCRRDWGVNWYTWSQEVRATRLIVFLADRKVLPKSLDKLWWRCVGGRGECSMPSISARFSSSGERTSKAQ